MFANFATALPAGAAMTFLILFAMQSLIAMQPGAAAEVTRTPPRIPIYVPRTEELHRAEHKPEKIPDPMPLPPTVIAELDPVDGPGLPVARPNLPTGPNPGMVVNSGFNDGPLVAIVRVAPTYPTSLIARGIEGWVTVIFDVLPDGSVTNIAVLNSSHSGFERNAMRAASRFKFKARVVEGVPQTSSGIQYKFTFEMDK